MNDPERPAGLDPIIRLPEQPRHGDSALHGDLVAGVVVVEVIECV